MNFVRICEGKGLDIYPVATFVNINTVMSKLIIITNIWNDHVCIMFWMELQS